MIPLLAEREIDKCIIGTSLWRSINYADKLVLHF